MITKAPVLGLAVFFVATAGAFAQDRFHADADRIIAETLANSQSYALTAHLADKIGPRLSGSRGAELAVQWATSKFRQWGIAVRNEKVIVPRWVRGGERASLVSHNNQRIILTALGGSVATSPSGITADVVEVKSFEELQRLGRKAIAGRIVLYTAAMDMSLVEAGNAFEAYSKAVAFRSSGADRAAEYGAVAALNRSPGSIVHRTPHTGALRYGGKQKPIPAAAVSAEDSMLIQRLLARGERVRMHLVLTPRTLPDVESANVVAEIRGREKPEEIVLIGGHLDSWDLGTGAIDNAAGVAMIMDTMRLFRELGVTPRRTVRAVLYMNEENGLRGARAYAKDHAAELDKHVAAIESDAGATNPLGFRTTLSGDARDAFVAPLLGPLGRLDATLFETSQYTGADTMPLVDAGVPGFGLITDPRHYFHYHHTRADTLDKIDRDQLTQATAAFVALTWMLAEREDVAPRGTR
ncbi:MAG TPA: M20/M25/M40 family metallo-hydrolase [Thermoanaerobaculia bacterium]|nr:M20/M25/M40 family metallo-hydrolase [Thermoanaerobaculia bacterium]